GVHWPAGGGHSRAWPAPTIDAVLVLIGPPVAGIRGHGPLPQLMQRWCSFARRGRAFAAIARSHNPCRVGAHWPAVGGHRGRNAAPIIATALAERLTSNPQPL